MIDRTVDILKEKRFEWIKKRALYIEVQQEHINNGDDIIADNYNALIEKCQESISDFTEVIDTINNIYNHHNQMKKIINNQKF